MDRGVRAAVRRLPAWQGAIETLAIGDAEFRSMCADLADAEAALRGWEGSSSPTRDRFCAEYRALVLELADEIEATLKARLRA